MDVRARDDRGQWNASNVRDNVSFTPQLSTIRWVSARLIPLLGL